MKYKENFDESKKKSSEDSLTESLTDDGDIEEFPVEIDEDWEES